MAMPAHTTATELLISAFQERDIRFTREVIAKELEDGSIAKWVTEHISPHTLLSKDEAALVKSLERSGILETFLREPELASTRALTEDDIRAATATLKSSTENCVKQISALKTQLELIEKLQTGRREADRQHDLYVSALNRQHLLEKQRIKSKAADVTIDFESRMLEYRQQKHANRKQLIQNVSTKLLEDDKVLRTAEKIAAQLEMTEMDEQMEKRVLGLISTLSKLISEEIRCRLDRLYLETVLADSRLPADPISHPDDDVHLALEEDLDSLYSEIEVLAEMSAKQEYERPILEALRKKKQHSAHSLEEDLEMILEVLFNMTNSTRQQVNEIRYHQSHREALDQLSVLFREEITPFEVEQIQSKKSHRRSSSMPSFSPSKAPQPRTSYSTTQSFPALESFLRRFGISSSTLSASLALKDLVSAKRSEMTDLLHHNLSMSAELPLYESLSSSDEAKEFLTLILQADSHAEPSLLDHNQRHRLAELEKELMSIRKQIEDVDLGSLAELDRARDKFVDRWK